MNLFHLPWLEISVFLPLLGALSVGRLRDPMRAYRWGLAFTGAVFLCTLLACCGFYLGIPEDGISVQDYFLGRRPLRMDELSAPLVAVVGLLHFLTALATAHTKMRRFSISWSLAAESIRLATFGCKDPATLIILLIVSTLPPYVELTNRGKSTRVYALHMGLFASLLLVGLALMRLHGEDSIWAMVPLTAAVLVRCGTVPLHCWLTDWFENASFGNALLFMAPLVGVYAAVQLVLPHAPVWILRTVSYLSLATAFYAAGMAIVQRDGRRFFAYLFLSHTSLILIGLELHTRISLTGALCLWFSVILSLGGFGLTLRALEARIGKLSLTDYHGLYDHVPTMAIVFLLTGLASVGFPGTLGFLSTELLVDGAVEFNLYVGFTVIGVAALNGIAVVRAYFLLFTGKRHASMVSLRFGMRERIALLTLAALIVGGGLYPQPGVQSRYRVAEEMIPHEDDDWSRLHAQPDELLRLAALDQ